MQTDDFRWDNVRRAIDEVDLKIHLASMELRDRWQQLRPVLVEQLGATDGHLRALSDELASELARKEPQH